MFDRVLNKPLSISAFPLKLKLYLESISNKTKIILKRAFPIKQKFYLGYLLKRHNQHLLLIIPVNKNELWAEWKHVLVLERPNRKNYCCRVR